MLATKNRVTFDFTLDEIIAHLLDITDKNMNIEDEEVIAEAEMLGQVILEVLTEDNNASKELLIETVLLEILAEKQIISIDNEED